jgi:pyridoxal 5-phosphate dependent beta-lyase
VTAAWCSGWQRRPDTPWLHFDSAAAGRSSLATLTAAAEHARLEAEVGAYVAEERAADILTALRADLSGLLGVPAEGMAFVESATAALASLLQAWPLPTGARVGVTPSEWGPNLEAFTARGLVPEQLTVDVTGRLDLEALVRRLTDDPPALIHLVHVAPHRGLVQPVAEAGAVCRRLGVPLWVDAAQAVGHVPSGAGADAVYGTSRKWLCGPRGVGFLGIDDRHWDSLRVPPAGLGRLDQSPVRLLESSESHVAGRVGLAVAVREFLAAGPDRVAAHLDEVGRMSREALMGVKGWRLVGAGHVGAITALAPTDGQDVSSRRARLMADHRILISASPPWRTPGELTQPLLRVSPHVDCTREDLVRLSAALAED